MGSDEEVIRTDGLTNGFQFGSDSSIFGVGRHIKCEHLHTSKNGLDVRQ